MLLRNRMLHKAEWGAPRYAPDATVTADISKSYQFSNNTVWILQLSYFGLLCELVILLQELQNDSRPIKYLLLVKLIFVQYQYFYSRRVLLQILFNFVSYHFGQTGRSVGSMSDVPIALYFLVPVWLLVLLFASELVKRRLVRLGS